MISIDLPILLNDKKIILMFIELKNKAKIKGVRTTRIIWLINKLENILNNKH